MLKPKENKIKKTNAARILDKHKIHYETLEYRVDEADLSALHVARDVNTDIKIIFKTLVTVDEKNRPIVACIPGDDELDLKALAHAAEVKKCTMIPLKDILKTTGYIRGGCSPVGMKKVYRTFIHKSALSHGRIFVSAGVRGQQLLVAPKDLEKVLELKFEDIVHAAHIS